jgi:hypothetical protein
VYWRGAHSQRLQDIVDSALGIVADIIERAGLGEERGVARGQAAGQGLALTWST